MTILDSDSEDNIEDDSVVGNYLIQEYSPTDDRWSTLPPAPVCAFGMGELNGQLVIVGGETRRAVTGKVHTSEMKGVHTSHAHCTLQCSSLFSTIMPHSGCRVRSTG